MMLSKGNTIVVAFIAQNSLLEHILVQLIAGVLLCA